MTGCPLVLPAYVGNVDFIHFDSLTLACQNFTCLGANVSSDAMQTQTQGTHPTLLGSDLQLVSADRSVSSLYYFLRIIQFVYHLFLNITHVVLLTISV